jgi:20S proteasome subunit beta 7
MIFISTLLLLFISQLLASYGSLARFRDMQRMTALGSRTLLGTSGDISDFQYLTRFLHQYHITEVCCNDGHLMSPKQWYTALAAVLYKRRTENNPLWTANVLAGVEEDGSIFLGSCDLLGTQFQADSIATGYGAHLAQPLLREAVEAANARKAPLTEAEAFSVIEKCMKVLYYRDARSLDKVMK